MSVLLTLTALVLATESALAQAPVMHESTESIGVTRNHGFQMNDQYRLMIEQSNNVLTVSLIKRNRAASGGLVPNVVAGEGAVARYADKKVLAKVTAEVLKPSAPNYLRNPGERYRITIEGVELSPDFKSSSEVDAATAIDTYQREFARLEAMAYGIEREAIRAGAGLALGVFNDSGFMPANIPLTVRESSSGGVRGLDTLERRSLDVTSDMRQDSPSRLKKPSASQGKQQRAGLGAEK